MLTGTKRPRFYLAGKMSGLPDYNFPAFHAAAAELRRFGWEVVNPAELDGGNVAGEWADFMRRDIPLLLSCDAVAVLPGWEGSKGATVELSLAVRLGMPILDAGTMEPIPLDTLTIVGSPAIIAGMRSGFDRAALLAGTVEAPLAPGARDDDAAGAESILAEAERLINGPRQGDYGHPYDDFSRTAAFWTEILGDKLGDDWIEPEDVALCMAAVKLSRQVNKPGRDNLVDLCGYAGCYEKIAERRAEREAELTGGDAA